MGCFSNVILKPNLMEMKIKHDNLVFCGVHLVNFISCSLLQVVEMFYSTVQ